ncbi:MAG: AAA family ATPase [Bacteroidetes bacterium 4572_117]|nr:MAG: AAA family ATPase [Bacteroidetes bacterium 4572_117]
MFQRSYIERLKKWASKSDRKPLVLRGARQVGKTTIVKMFARQFKQYIYLNLEIDVDRELFETGNSFDLIIESLFFYTKKKRNVETLLFIDEIQNSPRAVSLLRYFYELANDIYVIAAGSLLETLIDKNISFPVGRTEYMILRPFSFNEFLEATNENSFLAAINKVPIPEYAISGILKTFRRYTLIGGMPEVLQIYVKTKSINATKPIFENLIISYLDDVEKYASKNRLALIIRHVIRNSFTEAGNRITFTGFGASNYKSQDIADAFFLLEKTFLLKLVYPTTSVKIPLQTSLRKSPKLQILDTGLVNYFAGLQEELFGTKELSEAHEGKIVEHIVFQELLAASDSALQEFHFWVREKKQSNAEVDFVFPYKGLLIPIEVKSGATGRLRSLHQFIDRSPHVYAVRFYSGKVQINSLKTIAGKEFYLLNLPYFLAGKLNEYLDWFFEKIQKHENV